MNNKSEHVQPGENAKGEADGVVDSQFAECQEFPLEPKVPNRCTLAALRESEHLEQLHRAESIQALFD